jgi:hypothetical protein
MAINQDRAFELPDGVIVNDAAGVFSGYDSPVGLDLPLGSLYLQNQGTGKIWQKSGLSVGNWTDLTLGGGGTPSEEFSINIVDRNTTILPKRQMIIFQELKIEAGFTLNIQGGLVII